MTPQIERIEGSQPDKLLGAAAVLIAAVMFLSGLGSPALMLPDEGRNAEVAREMMVSGSWLVPTLEGLPYLDKPAAYFAAVAVSLRVFGVNEWGARMPSALCGALVLILLYGFTRKRYDQATAALAVIVVATSPIVFTFSRLVIMDIALALCTVAAILAAYVAEEGPVPDRRWHAAGAAAAGLGMLVKGPVGALVPAVVLVAFFFLDGRRAALRRVFAPWNVLIVLGVFLPWFAALVRAHPEFFHYGVIEETLNRFFTPTFNRGKPFWYFGPVLLLALFPWTLVLVPMTIALWRARSRMTRADRLFVAWAVVVLVFFSLSRTKQPGYIVTGVIAAAVCVGRGFGYSWRNRDGSGARLVARAALALSGLAVVSSVAVGVAVARGAVEAGRLSAMTARERAIWSMWPAILVVFLAVAFLAAWAWARRRTGVAVAAFALFPLSLVTVLLPAVEGYAHSRSAKQLAGGLAGLPRDAEIACFNCYPPGLSFYLGKTVTIISGDATPLRSNFVLYWMPRLAERPATVVDPARRDAWLASRETGAVIVAGDGSRAELDSWVGSRVPVEAAAPGWWRASIPRPSALGDSPLFLINSVSGEICKKKGTVPYSVVR